MNARTRPSLLDLPGELRNRIYQFLLDPKLTGDFQPHDAIKGTCRQIRAETRLLSYKYPFIVFTSMESAMKFLREVPRHLRSELEGFVILLEEFYAFREQTFRPTFDQLCDACTEMRMPLFGRKMYETSKPMDFNNVQHGTIRSNCIIFATRFDPPALPPALPNAGETEEQNAYELDRSDHLIAQVAAALDVKTNYPPSRVRTGYPHGGRTTPSHVFEEMVHQRSFLKRGKSLRHSFGGLPPFRDMAAFFIWRENPRKEKKPWPVMPSP